MPADLHIHSYLSDGTDSPEKIVQMAKSVGLTTISLTDHDNVDGLDRIIEEGKIQGVEIIPGIEFTTEVPGAEIHILGYFIDRKNPILLDKLKQLQTGRVERIHKIVEKLNKVGVMITADDVFAIAKNNTPGRPHVAKAMIKNGAVSSFKEAFDRYIDFRGPAYVSHYKMSPDEAIKLICQVSGIAVFAHPAISARDEMIPEFISSGLKGIEVFYPTNRPEQTSKYKELAKKYGLIMTGGTDFHGQNSGKKIELGDLTIEDTYIDALKAIR